MKLTIIWIFVFLISLFIVNAQSPSEASINALNNATILKLHWYNASEDNSSIKALGTPTNGDAYFNTSACYNKTSGCWWNTDHSSGNRLAIPYKGTNYLINQTSGSQNISVSFWINASDQTANNKVVFWSPGADVNRGLQIYIDSDEALNMRLSGNGSFYGSDDLAKLPIGSWVKAVYILNATEGRAHRFINGTWNGSFASSGTANTASGANPNMFFGSHPSFGDRNFVGVVQCFNVYNRTLNYSEILYLNVTCPTPDGVPPLPPDTTPPEINADSYNMTSEVGEGCINWRTNKSNPCSTSDVTPTVNFTTNEATRCAIGTQDINFSNYTRLAINRNCTLGQGTQSHTCTLVGEDELVYDTSYIYISCEDTSNNQNITSTSGALALSITGLEAAGRTSIGKGIQNALLSSYTNYTDLQIYARNLSNGQVRGTFDRAAKKGSKMWTFNRIGVSDSHVNMFNLTPVLYVMEFANITSQNITNQTQALIEATD